MTVDELFVVVQWQIEDSATEHLCGSDDTNMSV
jgi:hypothetical protein